MSIFSKAKSMLTGRSRERYFSGITVGDITPASVADETVVIRGGGCLPVSVVDRVATGALTRGRHLAREAPGRVKTLIVDVEIPSGQRITTSGVFVNSATSVFDGRGRRLADRFERFNPLLRSRTSGR